MASALHLVKESNSFWIYIVIYMYVLLVYKWDVNNFVIFL